MGISEFVVKVASRCNIDCSYCYEFNLGDQTWKNQPELMDIKTFQKLCWRIKNHSQSHGLKEVRISFHGGEPLLLGKNRFVSFLKIIENELLGFVDASVNIQTNGILIDKTYLTIFKDYRVGLSISIDGPKVVNDIGRLGFKRESTFEKVISSIKLVQKISPDLFNGVLSVVNTRSCPEDVYQFFRDMDIMTMDFLLPDHNWDNPPINIHTPAYGDWLVGLYLAWINENNPDVFIGILDTIVRKCFGGRSNNEVFSIDPINFITISASGEYQALDALKSIGPGYYETGKTVFSAEIDEALACPNIKSRLNGRLQLATSCLDCEKVDICAGGYFPHRFKKDNGFKNASIYCKDLYHFISEVESDLAQR